jgi:hypothetical protein
MGVRQTALPMSPDFGIAYVSGLYLFNPDKRLHPIGPAVHFFLKLCASISRCILGTWPCTAGYSVRSEMIGKPETPGCTRAPACQARAGTGNGPPFHDRAGLEANPNLHISLASQTRLFPKYRKTGALSPLRGLVTSANRGAEQARGRAWGQTSARYLRRYVLRGFGIYWNLNLHDRPSGLLACRRAINYSDEMCLYEGSERSKFLKRFIPLSRDDEYPAACRAVLGGCDPRYRAACRAVFHYSLNWILPRNI